MLKNQIIPSSINAICFKFYYSDNIIIYLCKLRDNKNGIYITNYANKTKYDCIVYDLIKKETSTIDIISDLGINYASNVKIPYPIAKKVNSFYQKKNHSLNLNYSSRNSNYHAIFKCGAALGNDYANALIFDTKELTKTDKETCL